MSEATLWWVIAGVTVALELVTGTFYLLLLAIGMDGDQGIRRIAAALAAARSPTRAACAATPGRR